MIVMILQPDQWSFFHFLFSKMPLELWPNTKFQAVWNTAKAWKRRWLCAIYFWTSFIPEHLYILREPTPHAQIPIFTPKMPFLVIIRSILDCFDPMGQLSEGCKVILKLKLGFDDWKSSDSAKIFPIPPEIREFAQNCVLSNCSWARN